MEARKLHAPRAPEVIAFEVLDNQAISSIRALTLQTDYGSFHFGLDRPRMERLVGMLQEALATMPPSSS